MQDAYLIGLDYGSESARGVLINITTGRQDGYVVHPYAHGIMSATLPGGTPLPPNFALQVATDYLEAAEEILGTLGRDREIAGIGIDFTASSPLPARADGLPLSALHPDEPHAYVKLWKHAAAQPQADEINRQGGAFLDNFGGKLSGEWLLAKAAQIIADAPEIWDEIDRFIEAGDWLVWQLTGIEARSLDFAAYKAQFLPKGGYPEGVVPGLDRRVAPPLTVGCPAGPLSDAWRQRTGIGGAAQVAVAVIDSHVVLPAVGAVEPGAFVGALGTSAAFLVLDGSARELPRGLEGAAFGAVLPEVWCYEAGQAAFGDMLAWFVTSFPLSEDLTENFARHALAAERVPPGSDGLVALDWFGGNRIPHGDPGLSGMIAGLTLKSTPGAIYRSLVEALCFGTRSILEIVLDAGVPIDRIVMTSGLARSNPFLVQTMADALGHEIEVPAIDNPTCVGAAIHGAVAAKVVSDFVEGAARFGSQQSAIYRPAAGVADSYDGAYAEYLRLASDPELRAALRTLRGRQPRGSLETET